LEGVEGRADLADRVGRRSRRVGFFVDIAGSDSGALDFLQNQTYPVPMHDHLLPDGDGLETPLTRSGFENEVRSRALTIAESDLPLAWNCVRRRNAELVSRIRIHALA
jgi:hypothetical protein